MKRIQQQAFLTQMVFPDMIAGGLTPVNGITRILRGQQSILIDEFNDGEFSVLYRDIHKITQRLKVQTDPLMSEKHRRTTAIKDIFYKLRTPMKAMHLTI